MPGNEPTNRNRVVPPDKQPQRRVRFRGFGLVALISCFQLRELFCLPRVCIEAPRTDACRLYVG